jgi:hypothetical protein
MSENVKDKVKQVLGLMGMPADESAKLIYSWEAVPATTSHPIERCYVRIPDDQVAKVADRIAELEAEIAQLKAQDEWTTSLPKEVGYYWMRQVERRPTDHPKLVFIGEWVYDGVIRYSLSSFVDDWEFRKAR